MVSISFGSLVVLLGLFGLNFHLIVSDTDCSDAYSCGTTNSISDSTINCLGYESCNSYNLISTNSLNCAGGYSCTNSSLLSISGGDINCVGYSSCEESTIESREGNVYCNGKDSCRTSTLTLNGTSNNLECNGEYSCAEIELNFEVISGLVTTGKAICNGDYSCYNAASIESLDQLECNGYKSCAEIGYNNLFVDNYAIGNGYRAFYNTFIETTSNGDARPFSLFLYGDNSGENATLTCNKDCTVYCNSTTACKNLQIECESDDYTCDYVCSDDCDYECPEVRYNTAKVLSLAIADNDVSNENNSSLTYLIVSLFGVLSIISCGCFYHNNISNNSEYSEIIDHESNNSKSRNTYSSSLVFFVILLLIGLGIFWIYNIGDNDIASIIKNKSYTLSVDEEQTCSKSYYTYGWTSCSESDCSSRYKDNDACECAVETDYSDWDVSTSNKKWWGRRTCTCKLDCYTTTISCDTEDDTDCSDNTLGASYIYCRSANSCQDKTLINSVMNGYCQGDSSCKNSIINSEEDNILCEGESSCYSAQITTENNNIECLGETSCKYADLTSNNNILCDSEYACQDSTLSANNIIYCNGNNGCDDSTILLSDNTYCNGKESCINSHIEGTSTIYGYGEYSIQSSEIYSDKLDELNVYLNGEYSGDDLTIYCDGDSICNVYCETPNACTNAKMVCDNDDNCNVNGCNSTVTGCPYSCPTIE